MKLALIIFCLTSVCLAQFEPCVDESQGIVVCQGNNIATWVDFTSTNYITQLYYLATAIESLPILPEDEYRALTTVVFTDNLNLACMEVERFKINHMLRFEVINSQECSETTIYASTMLSQPIWDTTQTTLAARSSIEPTTDVNNASTLVSGNANNHSPDIAVISILSAILTCLFTILVVVIVVIYVKKRGQRDPIFDENTLDDFPRSFANRIYIGDETDV